MKCVDSYQAGYNTNGLYGRGSDWLALALTHRDDYLPKREMPTRRHRRKSRSKRRNQRA